jgi:hypothetical protein
MRHGYAILEAPSALGHVPEHLGVERASPGPAGLKITLAAIVRERVQSAWHGQSLLRAPHPAGDIAPMT